jgi:A/G-specific adenine glycosylase
MDLGATVCVRSRPMCLACPMQPDCVARRDGLQGELPTPRPKKIRPARAAVALIARNTSGGLLLERRPPAGLWGGLWTFPQFDTSDAALAWVAERFGDVCESQTLGAYEHAFTHFDLTLHPLIVSVDRAAAINDADRYMWYDAANPARVGLAKPAVDLVRIATRNE